MRTVLAITSAMAFAAVPVRAATPDPYLARVARVLAGTPLIDGHNDWAEALVDHAGDKRWTVDLNRLDTKDYDTDIERLRQGMLGGQFWSVYVSADLPELEQVKATLDQIDLVNQIVRRYPATFQMAMTASDVRAAHKAGKIASMIGVEGGGQIDADLSVLRAYRRLGAGYLTLTHARTIAWADSATDDPKHDGLTKFGDAVVGELNRLGMLVDLSHVSEAVMLDALAVTKAPVIFSHSSARALCDHPRNLSDAVLRKLTVNGGVVMVNFAPNYISDARRIWGAARGAEQARYNAPPFGGLYIGDPDKATAALAAWEKANPEPKVTISDVADHIDHIAKVAGVDHVGLGGDYDGLPALPEGMDGVEAYPALLAEMMRRGWSDADVAKLAGGNVLRVMEAAEKVAATMRDKPAATATVAQLDGLH
jgi:membrane dipeptidase